MNYIVVVKSCEDCGPQVGTGIFENYPAPSDIEVLKNSIGGMYCINAYVFVRDRSGAYTLVDEESWQ